MKKIFLLGLVISSLILVTINTNAEMNQSQDDNDNMIQLSKIIVSTIQKYDHTEKGVIPFEKYHLFLHQIFIKGHQLNLNHNPNSQVTQYISNLLKSATQDFKTFRYKQMSLEKSSDQESLQNEKKQPEKRQFIQLQQFYMDLIKHFSEFLDLEQNKEKYQTVNEFFFVENSQEKKLSNKEKLENQGEKLQL